VHPAHDYSEAGRKDFYETLGNLAAILANQGLIVLVPATAHLRSFRDEARQKAPRFAEIYVDTPLEECERRDPKGLYARARIEENGTLPGPGAAYEPPLAAEITAHGGDNADSAARILAWLGVD